jgi:hypothetical protein
VADAPLTVDFLEQVRRGVPTAIVHDDEFDLARKPALQNPVHHFHDGPLFVISGHENGQLDWHGPSVVITQERHIIHRA